MIALIVLPFLALLIYLIVRGKGMAERQSGAIRQAQADTDQYIKSVASSSIAAEQIAQPRRCSTPAPSTRPSSTTSRPRRSPEHSAASLHGPIDDERHLT